MRLPITLPLVALALLAGCGGDDSGGADKPPSKPGGPEGAAAFIECFNVAGFVAKKPNDADQSSFAQVAKSEGFANTPVNVYAQSSEALLTSVFLIFFEDGDKAKQALKATNAKSLGDNPPEQHGAAVLAYAYEEDRPKIEAAIKRCL